jgi:polyhydroxyalkanoate synthesis regulator phasin
MASDEELARHVSQVEGCRGHDGPSAVEELDEYREAAGEIHDELARRIEQIDEKSADEADLAAVVERLERLESRLDDLESRL